MSKDDYIIPEKNVVQKDWVSLSDDEIFSMCPFPDEESEEAFYRGGRAAEAKLKEKNNA